jgi:hypothetical protein
MFCAALRDLEIEKEELAKTVAAQQAQIESMQQVLRARAAKK